MSTTTSKAGALCLATALLLTACGGSSGSSGGGGASSGGSAGKQASQVQGLPADQVLAKAKQALASAKSVHFTLKTTGGSDGDASFDMKLAAGQQATGTLGTSGQQIKLVRVGKTAYLSGSEQLLAALSQGKAPAGKWVKMSADTPGLEPLLEFTDLSNGMGTVLKPKGKLTLGTPKAVDGKQTVALVDDDPKGGGTLYISAEGTPYPLLIESSAGKGTATFTEYDAPVTVTPPAASDVITVPGS